MRATHTWMLAVGGVHHRVPLRPSLCYDVKEGWVPVRCIDPTTGRPYDGSPGSNPGKEPHG